MVPAVYINTDSDLVYKNHKKASEFPKFVIHKSIKKYEKAYVLTDTTR